MVVVLGSVHPRLCTANKGLRDIMLSRKGVGAAVGGICAPVSGRCLCLGAYVCGLRVAGEVF